MGVSSLQAAQVDVESGKVHQRLFEMMQLAVLVFDRVQGFVTRDALLPCFGQPLVDLDQLLTTQRQQRCLGIGPRRVAEQCDQPVEVPPGAADAGTKRGAGHLRQFRFEQRPFIGCKGLQLGQHEAGTRQILTHQGDGQVPHIRTGAHQAAASCKGSSASLSS